MRCAPHPGQSDVPSDNARAQDGQLRRSKSGLADGETLFSWLRGLGLRVKMFEVTDLIFLRTDAGRVRGPALAQSLRARRVCPGWGADAPARKVPTRRRYLRFGRLRPVDWFPSTPRGRYSPGRLELTRRGDYAVRAMLALATDTTSAWLSVPRISASMAIPARFLPAVMTDLVRAGLVEGRAGRTGGYRLQRPAAAITLLDVIDAVEPEPDPRTCVLRGGPCGLDGLCAVHDAFTAAAHIDVRTAGRRSASRTSRDAGRPDAVRRASSTDGLARIRPEVPPSQAIRPIPVADSARA